MVDGGYDFSWLQLCDSWRVYFWIDGCDSCNHCQTPEFFQWKSQAVLLLSILDTLLSGNIPLFVVFIHRQGCHPKKRVTWSIKNLLHQYIHYNLNPKALSVLEIFNSEWGFLNWKNERLKLPLERRRENTRLHTRCYYYWGLSKQNFNFLVP